VKTRFLCGELKRLVKIARSQRKPTFYPSDKAVKESKKDEAMLPDLPIVPKSTLDIHPVILNASDDTSFRGCFVVQNRLFTCAHPDAKEGKKYRVALVQGGNLVKETEQIVAVKKVWPEHDICELEYKPDQRFKTARGEIVWTSHRLGRKPNKQQVVVIPFIPQNAKVGFEHHYTPAGVVTDVKVHEFDYKVSTTEGASGAGVYDLAGKTIFGWHLKGDPILGNTGHWFTEQVRKDLGLSPSSKQEN
jgi:hypothetical protein